MPPKNATRKNHAGGEKDDDGTAGSKGKALQREPNNSGILGGGAGPTNSSGKATAPPGKGPQVVQSDVIVLDEHGVSTDGAARAMAALKTAAAALAAEKGGRDGTPTGKAGHHVRFNSAGLDDGRTHGTVPTAEAERATAGASATGDEVDVDMEHATVKDKVNRSCDDLEKLFYAYGQQLVQTTQELLEQAKGIDAQSAEAINNSWIQVKKRFQPQLNRCLLNLVDSVPDDFEASPQAETAHPGMRAVAFRDLLENARSDITGSLEELTKWFATHAEDPAAVKSMADHKLAAYTQVYNAVLDKMGRDILERMADSGSVQVDFGRDSDYGQALEAQQALAKERDELQLQLEGFQKQVERLKVSEADLYVKCQDLQENFRRARDDLVASRDKVEILKAVTTFLGTDDTDVVGVLAHIQSKNRAPEAKVAEL